MATLETTKKLVDTMEPNSFLKLVANVLFRDINSIKAFQTHEMYYVDDIVLISKDITGDERDELFICNRDGVTGTYQPRDWRVFTLVQSDKHGFIENKRYTTIADGTTEIKLNVNISLDKHSLVLTHSVRGRLRKDTDWTFKDVNTILFKNFTLYEGEWIDIDFYE